MARPKRHALCHPEKQNYGKGYCRPCWQKNRYDSDSAKQKRHSTEWQARESAIKAAYVAARISRDPDYQRRLAIKRNYNLAWDDYLVLMEKQHRVCAICDQPEKSRKQQLHVDHDHTTGVIRGLLCSNCNNGLGRFKDNIMYLTKAAQYLSGGN